MRWTPARVAREVHFASSLLIVMLLAFFAITGFMANHREWFHPRVNHNALSAAVAIDGCTQSSLSAAVGAPATSVEAHGDWLFVDDPDGEHRHACVRDAEVRYAGVVTGWPEPTDHTPDGFERGWRQQQGYIESWRPNPPAGDLALYRRADVWEHRVFEVDVANDRIVAYTHRLPFAFSLIELHRGHGNTDLLIDAVVILVLIVALSGIAHGLRYPGWRRRFLGGLLLGSALLFGWLFTG